MYINNEKSPRRQCDRLYMNNEANISDKSVRFEFR